MARAHRPARAPVSPDLEFSAASLDIARALDRAEPARGGHDPRRNRARWADAVDRRRRDVARPPAGRAARRAFARVASARAWARVRSRRRGSRLERRRGSSWIPADEGRDRHYTWSVAVDPEDPDLWYVSASSGPFAAHGRGDPQAKVFRRRDGTWEALAGGLPDPLSAMPYALVATRERLFAGLANGELWESRDRGDSWQRCELLDGIPRLSALVAA